MRITEVRVKIMGTVQDGARLLAFATVTFDDLFVVRDLRVIDGQRTRFVAMPSRKLTDRCLQCRYTNHLRARYCNHCGQRLDEERAARHQTGRIKLYADVAHPIRAAFRGAVEDQVLAAYEDEVRRSKEPGYVSTYDYDPNDRES